MCAICSQMCANSAMATSLRRQRGSAVARSPRTCAQHIILRGALRPWSPSWRSCPTDDVSSTVHTQHRRHMRQRLAPRTLPNAASPDLRDPRFTKPCWPCPRREVDAVQWRTPEMPIPKTHMAHEFYALYPVHSRRPQAVVIYRHVYLGSRGHIIPRDADHVYECATGC